MYLLPKEKVMMRDRGQLVLSSLIITLNYRKFDSRLTAREFRINENDSCEISNKADTSFNVPRGCRMKETACTEPDQKFHNKIAMNKSVNRQDDEDYEVMNNYTMLQGDDNVYDVPDIATTTIGRGPAGIREDTYYYDVPRNNTVTVSRTTATTAMQPGDGEGENGLEVYDDLDNPGKFGLH
jgi:hypothetical protein